MDTQPRASSADTGLLGLESVLIGSLPPTLMTDDAPDRYTVEAIFTRQPERDEVTQIIGKDTQERLAQAGYPAVKVAVSDRRMEIANTNLEELREGLATILADRLTEISANVQEQHEAAAIRFQDAAESEDQRAAAVAALADAVRFEPSRKDAEHTSVPEPVSQAATDRAQIDNWIDEGGRGP